MKCLKTLLSGRSLVISIVSADVSALMSLSLFLILDIFSMKRSLKLSASYLFDSPGGNGRSWFADIKHLFVVVSMFCQFLLKISFLCMIHDVWYFPSLFVEVKVFLSVVEILLPDFSNLLFLISVAMVSLNHGSFGLFDTDVFYKGAYLLMNEVSELLYSCMNLSSALQSL